MQEFAELLGIDIGGTYARDGSYVIDLGDANMFGRIYSILDNNEDLEYIETTSLLNVNNSSLNYRYGDEYQISLIADFNQDQYKVVIEEM